MRGAHDAAAHGHAAPQRSAHPGGRGFRSLSAQEFKTAFRHHPGGVSLITATGPEGPVAMTATSVASVSAEPPLLVFSVSQMSSSFATMTHCDTFVAHLLTARNRPLAELGATSGIDRFADTSLWRSLPTGEPVFHGTRWLRARVVSRLAAGTATVIVGHAIEADAPSTEDDGLVYVDRTWHRIGDHSRDG